MTILVTGSTGTVGSQVLPRLAGQGIPVRALTRDPSKLTASADVEPVAGGVCDGPDGGGCSGAVVVVRSLLSTEVMGAPFSNVLGCDRPGKRAAG